MDATAKVQVYMKLFGAATAYYLFEYYVEVLITMIVVGTTYYIYANREGIRKLIKFIKLLYANRGRLEEIQKAMNGSGTTQDNQMIAKTIKSIAEEGKKIFESVFKQPDTYTFEQFNTPMCNYLLITYKGKITVLKARNTVSLYPVVITGEESSELINSIDITYTSSQDIKALNSDPDLLQKLGVKGSLAIYNDSTESYMN